MAPHIWPVGRSLLTPALGVYSKKTPVGDRVMVGFLEDMVLDRQRDTGQPQLSICTFKGKAMPTNDVAAEEKRREVISEPHLTVSLEIKPILQF